MAIATGTAIALGASAAASAYGAHKASSASKKASEQQQQSAQQALAQQRAMYEQTRGDLGPYRETGGQGLTSLAGLLGVGGGPGGSGAAGMQAALEQSPGYQFRLNEGLKALQRSAAARGTLLTGGTLKGLERYAQDYASGEYGTRVNQLAGLSQMGANAAAGQAGQNAAFGNAAGGLMTDVGNAQAAGTIGSGNAWQQGLGQAGNLAQMYYLSRMFGSAPPGGATPVLPSSRVVGIAPLYTGPSLAGAPTAQNAGWMSPWIKPVG